MKAFLCNLLLTLLVVTCFACSRVPEKDQRVEKLENDVQKLAEQNKKLQSEVEHLQTQLSESQTQPASPTVQSQPAAKKMTVDRMKIEIRPALDKAIQDLKKSAETPREGNQFGMRVEYDLKKAFYGLIETGNDRVPYQAKVIVTFEKFLESETDSKSYGKGSTMLMFAYRNNRWELLSSK
jgi:vacuolar-type H+-ATPase subunit I/STV1